MNRRKSLTLIAVVAVLVLGFFAYQSIIPCCALPPSTCADFIPEEEPDENVDDLYRALQSISGEPSLVQKEAEELYGILNLDSGKFDIHRNVDNVQILPRVEVDSCQFARSLELKGVVAYEVNAEHSIWQLLPYKEKLLEWGNLSLELFITDPLPETIEGESYYGNLGDPEGTSILDITIYSADSEI